MKNSTITVTVPSLSELMYYQLFLYFHLPTAYFISFYYEFHTLKINIT